MNIPKSLVGHDKVLSCIYELRLTPITIESLQESIDDIKIEDESHNSTTTNTNNKSHKLWRRNKTNDSFPFSYHPNVRSIKMIRGISTASAARLG